MTFPVKFLFYPFAVYCYYHGCYPTRYFYALAHENTEAVSAIWGRMLHICASRSVLLFTDCVFAGL